MTKFCPECGTKQRDDNNHYCPNCGFDFSSLERDSNLNLVDSDNDKILDLDNSSVDVPIEPLDKEDSKFAAEAKSSVASSDSSASSSSAKSPISSIDSSTSSSSAPRSSTKKPSTSSVKVSSSSTKRTKNYSSNSSKNDLLSNLSFNKCFLAFAVLLIIMVIGGMILDATVTEPYSDDGLTSFMYESNNYNLDSFIEDYNSYDDSDSESDYLSYAAYDVSTILKN